MKEARASNSAASRGLTAPVSADPLVAALILHELGMPGEQVVHRLRQRRPGALFNERFAEFVGSLRT